MSEEKPWLLNEDQTSEFIGELDVGLHAPVDYDALCRAQHLKTLEWLNKQMAVTVTRLGNVVVAIRREEWEILLTQARKEAQK